jgi:hypothetical protein
VKIFLSYRRNDAGGHAGRLADALRQRLGPGGVFQDVSAIAPGEDFTAAIDRGLAGCDAVLAVIGRDWLGASMPDGGRRLLQPDDYVRLELARALERGVPVVPVLVGRASLPAAGDLPDDLAGLVSRQAVVLHDETWHEDVSGLLRRLRGEMETPSRRPRRRLVAALAAVAVVAAAAGVWLARDRSGGDEDGPPPTACAPPTAKGWRAIRLASDPTLRAAVDGGVVIYSVRAAHARKRGDGWQVVLGTSMDNTTGEPLYNGDYHYPTLIVGKREFAQRCYEQQPDLVAAGTIGDAVAGFDVRCEPTGRIELATDEGRLAVTDPALEPGPC